MSAHATENAPVIDLIDLEAAYAKGTLIMEEGRRRTDTDAHLGTHLAGLCDRQSWAARKGLTAPIEDIETLTGFWLGHAAEEGLLNRIDAGLDERFFLDRNVQVHLGGLVGHADAVIFDGDENPVAVIDTKSTVWWPNNKNGKQVWQPKEVRHNQILQVCAYALALNAPHAALYELDLGGKSRRLSWFTVADYAEEILQRVKEVRERTDPANPEPDVRPNWGNDWACGSIDRNGNVRRAYCSFTACKHHVENTTVDL